MFSVQDNFCFLIVCESFFAYNKADREFKLDFFL